MILNIIFHLSESLFAECYLTLVHQSIFLRTLHLNFNFGWLGNIIKLLYFWISFSQPSTICSRLNKSKTISYFTQLLHYHLFHIDRNKGISVKTWDFSGLMDRASSELDNVFCQNELTLVSLTLKKLEHIRSSGVNIFLWEGAFYLVGYRCFDPQSAWYFAFCCKNSCRITNVHLLCLKQFKIIHSTHSYPSSSIPSAGFISFDFATLKHFSLFYDK